MRHSRIQTIIALALLTVPFSRQTTAQQVWLEQDGFVIVEAEDLEGLAGKQWAKTIEKPGFTGNGALMASGSNNNGQGVMNYSESMATSNKTIRYRIKITKPGFYELKLRNWHHAEDGGNDVWVSLNKRQFKKFWDHDVKVFSWDEGHTRFYGEWLVFDSIPKDSIVDLLFSCRSAYFHLDRFALFTNGVSSSVWADTAQKANPTTAQFSKTGPSPAIPTGLKTEVLTPLTAILSWSKAVSSIWRYEIHLDGVFIGSTTASQFVFDKLIPGAKNTVTVIAKTLQGVTSAASQPISFSVPTFTAGNQGAYLQKAKTALLVDGSAEELWNSVPVCTLSNVILGSASSKADLSAVFRIIWNDQHLFALVDVKDDIVRTGTTPESKWDAARRDGVDIHVDLNRTRLCYNGPHDFNYRLCYGDTRPYEVANWYETNRRTDGVKVAWKKTGDGYTMEFSAPWATMGVVPKAGSIIGLDVFVNDDDTDAKENSDPREARIAWWETKKDYVSQWNFWPERLGQALLSDGPLKAAVPRKNSAAPANDKRSSWIRLNGQSTAIAGHRALAPSLILFDSRIRNYSGRNRLVLMRPERRIPGMTCSAFPGNG